MTDIIKDAVRAEDAPGMFQIKQRFTGDVLFECKLPVEVETAPYKLKLGFAVKAAVKACANLARANLADADLACANLARANLAGANLACANLAGANLVCANLARANLAGANLVDANLVDADLAGANLACANLVDANLAGANLVDANLVDADLASADLAGANLARADLACANLARANLAGANLVDAGQRSDGYRFIGWVIGGVLQIRAGCRNLSITEARKHWAKTRGGTQLGDETMVILDHIERVAKIRRLLKS